MNARVTIDENAATSFEETDGHPNGHVWPKAWFATAIRSLWPVKGAVAVEQYAGVPDRTARNYQSGHSDPSGAVICNLLRGNEGYRVLVWIMAGSTTTWWIVIQHERAVYARLKSLSPALREIIDDCA